MSRTTKADLMHLVIEVERESRILGIVGEHDTLTLQIADKAAGRPYRLSVGVITPYAPADGNQGDIGRTAREAEHTLRIIWSTLRAARKAVGR